MSNCPADLVGRPEEAFWNRILETKSVSHGRVEILRLVVKAMVDEGRFEAALTESLDAGDADAVKIYQSLLSPLRNQIAKLLGEFPGRAPPER